MNPDELKHCPICNSDLPVGDFGICRARKDGRNLYCMGCIRAKVKESRRILREYKTLRKQYRKERELARYYNEPEPVVESAGPPKLKPVDKVREAIRNGLNTQSEIRTETKLHKDVIADAIADLLLWTNEITTQLVGNERLYFIREAESKPSRPAKPGLPFIELLSVIGPRAKGSVLSKVREEVKTKAVA